MGKKALPEKRIYFTLAVEAITSLADATGSSQPAIEKYIASTYKGFNLKRYLLRAAIKLHSPRATFWSTTTTKTRTNFLLRVPARALPRRPPKRKPQLRRRRRSLRRRRPLRRRESLRRRRPLRRKLRRRPPKRKPLRRRRRPPKRKPQLRREPPKRKDPRRRNKRMIASRVFLVS